MPVARADDHPSFELGGNTITGFASPSRGATECILYRVEVPPGGGLPPHRHDHQDVFTVAAGSGRIFIDDEVPPTWESYVAKNRDVFTSDNPPGVAKR